MRPDTYQRFSRIVRRWGWCASAITGFLLVNQPSRWLLILGMGAFVAVPLFVVADFLAFCADESALEEEISDAAAR